MSMIYVSHKYGGVHQNINKAKKITHDLQVADVDNCYICPLTAFSHIEYCEIGRKEEMDLCEDLLTVCDVLLVASEISAGMQQEIDLAKKIQMEIRYLDRAFEK